MTKQKKINAHLFVLSVWMLFLELFLIRWISTEIRIFAYVNNLVLLACFIGMGLGCYFAERPAGTAGRRTREVSSVFFFLSVLILAVKSGFFSKITELLSPFMDSVIWGQIPLADSSVVFLKVAAGILMTIFIFSLIAAVFFPLGLLLGRMFNDHPKTITAYSFNILGSIAGIWLFGGLSFLYAPPWVWLVIALVLGSIFLNREGWDLAFFAIFAVFSLALLWLPGPGLFTLWSPYQKLTVEKHNVGMISNGYVVNVNNIGYMGLYDISDAFARTSYGAAAASMRRINQYEIPCQIKGNAEDVLIVGAGGGNDVAGALRQNARSIDAVEIDPGVYRIGKELHPEHPYLDPRVHIVIDDARSFFKKTNKRYDVISLGLLDSHVLSSQYNNVRLDHYVYTKESFEEARKLLKPDGIMTVTFFTKRSWIAFRLYNILKEVFQAEPLMFSVSSPQMVFGPGGTMFVASRDPSTVAKALAKDPKLSDYIRANGIYMKNAAVKITTDDWPYLYVEKPSIPKMYLCVIASLIALLLLGKQMLFRATNRVQPHFFFLGAAFMLLEFQNISKSSLLFGATWLVNAYMISAILTLILAANLFVHYIRPKRIWLFYVLLGSSVLGLYFLPLSELNIASYWLKSTCIAAILNLPIFFAGVIFIDSFQRCAHKSSALGSNLLGSCFGGLMETISFITGIKAVLLLVFLLYAAAYLFRDRRS